MTPDRLYELYRESLLSEDCESDSWDQISDTDRIAWGKLCRRLQQEHGLQKDAPKQTTEPKRRPRPIYQEDDALIHGRDPDYRGIHEWWEKTFPGRAFKDDWSAAKETEVDGGDCWTRMIDVFGATPNWPNRLSSKQKLVLTVTRGVDGYSVDKAEIMGIT